MKPNSLLSLALSFLVLCPHVAQPGFREILQKPGFCPDSWYVCPVVLIADCWIDSNCKESKKCCFYHCKQQCMLPVSEQDANQEYEVHYEPEEDYGPGMIFHD
ncbi:WAP four-disulfide core domain protein 15A-like [Sorex araneus]|uniref:WAP four-disulfide core domain protein 15A-like n=1 Tax=Sorex araneus TaxID=42254 RepID=UPI002433F6A7|nr:WAP four-disulfide core domain protein 15A-like [Sorex araneus]